MFGENKIYGRKYFKENAPDKSLKVTSLFLTLQGEGPYSGRPAVFLRLSFCNLQCWFCDTYFDDGEFYDIYQIQQMVRDKIIEQYGDASYLQKIGIVITGGEPMLQQNYLTDLVNLLNQSNHPFIQIETNGTISPTDEFIQTGISIVVSPKCVEKNKKEISYIKPSDKLLKNAKCLKFVLTSDKNSLYHTVPEWVNDYKTDVYISPMNIYNNEPRNHKIDKLFNDKRDLSIRSTDDEVISFWTHGLLNLDKNKENHEYAAKYCLDHGYILQLQVHLYAGLA